MGPSAQVDVNKFATVEPSWACAPESQGLVTLAQAWDRVPHMALDMWPRPWPWAGAQELGSGTRLAPGPQAGLGLAKKHHSAMKMKHVDAKRTTVQ